jgi:hypothetical protein
MMDRYETEALKALTDVQRVLKEMGIATTIESSDFDRDMGVRDEARTASLQFTFPRIVPAGANLSLLVNHRSESMHVSVVGRIYGKHVSNKPEHELERDTQPTADLIRQASDFALLKYYHALESAVLGRPIRA